MTNCLNNECYKMNTYTVTKAVGRAQETTDKINTFIQNLSVFERQQVIFNFYNPFIISWLARANHNFRWLGLASQEITGYYDHCDYSYNEHTHSSYKFEMVNWDLRQATLLICVTSCFILVVQLSSFHQAYTQMTLRMANCGTQWFKKQQLPIILLC